MGTNLLIDTLSMLPVLLAKTTQLSDFLTPLWGYFQVALGLGFVIFVHELGHFLAAKTFGVRCDKFYVGFDVPISIGPIKLPSTLGKFTWGETEYGIGIIPLGGYVKMLGQDDDPRKAEEEAERIRQGGADAPLDPRSYPAKPVWQRMIIISAGVVMNLIFAVILAAVAFKLGVPYTPTVIGNTIGGGPAWQAGLQPGDRVLRVGSMTEDDPNLRFNDLRMEIAISGLDKKGVPLPMTIERGGERMEISPAPTTNQDPDRQHYTIGVTPPTSTKLGGESPIMPSSYLATFKPDLQAKDVVVAVDDATLPVDPHYGVPLGLDMTEAFQAKWNQPVKLTVERAGEKDKAPTKVEVELPPVPVKTLGLDFKIGTISAIRAGSVAEDAGVKSGDTIVAIDGEEVVRALQLPSLIAAKSGQQIQLRVRRTSAASVASESAKPATNSPGEAATSSSDEADADKASADSAEQPSDKPAADVATTAPLTTELDFQITVPEKARFDAISGSYGVMTLAQLGIAYNITNTISYVDASIAGENSLNVGDQLAQVRWEPTDELKTEMKEYYLPQGLKVLLGNQVIDQSTTIATIFDQWQKAPDQMNIRCYAKRDGKTMESVVKLQDAKDWYWHQRGLALTELTDTHIAESISEAASLGAWETWRRFKEVLGFLRMLVTGKIGASGVGGPIAIFSVAGAEASHGVSRLLLFLTFLSANLAILNFLPIPALDGGHMMFLTAEAVRGKPVNEDLQIRLTMAGVMCLLCLMAFVIIKDIVELL